MIQFISKKSLYWLLFLLSLYLQGTAQQKYIGTWQNNDNIQGNLLSIKAELQIGVPQHNILFPATLKIECDSFIGTYKLLLALKKTDCLAISKNKTPSNEFPFSLSNSTDLLTGLLEFKQDVNGNPFFEFRKLRPQLDVTFARPKTITAYQQAIFDKLIQFFNEEKLEFKKVSTETPEQNICNSILFPSDKNNYYGLVDTLFVKSNDATISFKKNNDNDLISIKLNDEILFDQIDSKKKREEEAIQMDTGLNILSFFTDDFGGSPSSGAAIKLYFENYSKTLSYNDVINQGANFIAARIYIKSTGEGQKEMSSLQKTYDSSKTIIPKNSQIISTPFALGYSNRDNKIAGDFVTTSPQLTFAIWDDAIEDGDSISLSVNDVWITRTFAVKKNPQFITVSLLPGPNIITFVANNLGGIPPNTSVLEIIDGKKRKSFSIQTDMNQNNLVKILYDIK